MSTETTNTSSTEIKHDHKEIIIPMGSVKYEKSPFTVRKEEHLYLIPHYDTEGDIQYFSYIDKEDAKSFSEEYVQELLDVCKQIFKLMQSSSSNIEQLEHLVKQLYLLSYSYPPVVLNKYKDKLQVVEKKIYQMCLERDNYTFIEFLIRNTDMAVDDKMLMKYVSKCTKSNLQEKLPTYRTICMFNEAYTNVVIKQISKELLNLIIDKDIVEFMTILLEAADAQAVYIPNYVDKKFLNSILNHVSLQMFIVISSYVSDMLLDDNEILITSLLTGNIEVSRHLIATNHTHTGDMWYFFDELSFVELSDEKTKQNIISLYYENCNKKEYHKRLIEIYCPDIDTKTVKYNSMKDVIRLLCSEYVNYKLYIKFIPLRYKQYILEFVRYYVDDSNEYEHNDIKPYTEEYFEYIFSKKIPVEDRYIDYLLDIFTYDTKQKFVEVLKKYNINKQKSVVQNNIEEYIDDFLPISILKTIAMFREEDVDI